MRRCRCAGAVAVGLLAGLAGVSVPMVGLGISQAEAASFYTRKRVNGRWITGRFPKGATASSTRRTRTARGRAAIELDDESGVPMPPVRDAALASFTSVRSVPEPLQEIAELKTELAPAEPISIPVLETTPDDRLLKLRRALQVRADELASGPVIGSASAPASAPSSAPTTLEPERVTPPGGKTAASLAPSLSAPPPAAAPIVSVQPAPPAAIAPPRAAGVGPLEPKSISYDFETGIKTTVFESSVVREPFDVAALRGVAGRVPPLR